MAKDIKLKVIIDSSGNAKSGIASIAGSVGKLGTIAAGVATGGLLLAAGGVVALGKGLFDSVGAAMAAQEGQAQLAAVLASTQGASGMTAESINALASSLQDVTMFEDDAVLAGQNMLLTFTRIGKEVFPQATETILDMATALGGDTVSNAKILGKALNDPVAGLTALGRAGVQFTDAQKAMITAMVESGDVVGAQKLILAELETQIGGSARAAGETLPGKLAILKNTFGDIQETIGGAFLPALSSVADELAAGLKSDQAQAALKAMTGFITESVVPAIGDIMTFVGEATTMFMNWSSQLSGTTGPAMVLIQDALDRISIATGGATEKFSLSKTLLALFAKTLDAVVIAIKLLALGLQGAALVIEGWSATIRTVKGLVDGFRSAMNTLASGVSSAVSSIAGSFERMASAARRAISSIPKWLRPGSPTPFEIGLKGIAGAAKSVAGALPEAFAVTGAGSPGMAGASPGLAGAGAAGGLSLVVNYSPVLSTAGQIEIERNLIPLILDGLRKAGVKVG